VGVPVGKSETSLPFFKQYYSGGPYSMRGWPIRGIGQGARAFPGYNTTTFNDRTGDIKLEANYEYRYIIAQIIPNTLVLKGALFVDAGNIWNFKNTRTDGGEDSLQFVFKNLYKQLGVAAGTGFRFDFNYFLIRFDLGFRFKRPDILKDDGWQIPDITFDNLLKKGVKVPDPSVQNPNATINDERYKKWRYENFNFTIGIGVPF
jgi:outer membrane protein assembly factor BamA